MGRKRVGYKRKIKIYREHISLYNTVPVGQDYFLHIICHEKVVKSPTLIPLHEGFLGPRDNDPKLVSKAASYPLGQKDKTVIDKPLFLILGSSLSEELHYRQFRSNT